MNRQYGSPTLSPAGPPRPGAARWRPRAAELDLALRRRPRGGDGRGRAGGGARLARLAMGSGGAVRRLRRGPMRVSGAAREAGRVRAADLVRAVFVLFFAFRPAWHLANENFIYAGRLISPTFTKMLVAGLLAGTGFVIGYLMPGARLARVAASAPPEAGASPPADLVPGGAGGRPGRFRGPVRPAAAGRTRRTSSSGKNRIRFQEIAAKPTATSKYFIASIVLMIPAALLFLSIRQSAGTVATHRAHRRMGRAGRRSWRFS